ncbi:hypothetical protein D3C86_1038740 [compost metagenome]
MAPMRLDSVREVPGRAMTLTVAVPSLKGGKNSRPKKGTIAPAMITSAAATASTGLGCRRVRARIQALTRFSWRTSQPSWCCPVAFALGRR